MTDQAEEFSEDRCVIQPDGSCTGKNCIHDRPAPTQLEYETKWKIQLANAVLAEAAFDKCPMQVGDKIEHQLGTVWVGDKCSIVTFKQEGC
jgi:hypothetical protein